MAEEKTENFTAVSFPESKQEQEQLIHCRKSPQQEDVIVDDAANNEKGCRVLKVLRQIVILVTWSILGFFCLNGLIIQMYPIGSTCPKDLKAMLDYPISFPRMVALTQLDASIWFLAKRYADEFLGSCYVSNSYIPTIPRDELPELAIDHSDGLSHNIVTERPIDTSRPVLSFSVSDIQALEINAGHGIAVSVYIEDVQSSNVTQMADQNTHNDLVSLYFKEFDEESAQNSIDIHWTTDGSGSATVNFLPNQVTNSTIRCLLKIVLPSVAQLNDQTSKETLQHLSVSIKEGRILAEHVTLNYLTTKIGRGLVEARNIRANRLIAAVLDGEIALYGPKIKQALAAGVIRGSSTVLVKVDADSHSKFDVINMCSNGYTYTDVMMTEDSLDYFAADFYVYRDNGAPKNIGQEPMLMIDGDTYGSAPQDFAHMDEGSTDVYKTGYMGMSENSGSHILVYSGAKTPGSRIMNSRFLYGLYYENTAY